MARVSTSSRRPSKATVSNFLFDAAAHTPPIPSEITAFLAQQSPQAESGVMAVGKPGKVGLLDLDLVVGKTGQTGMGQRFFKAPVSLTRPLYVDPADSHHAVLYVRMTGGGAAENDRVRQEVRLASGAQATVTTQAATNVHRMNQGLATQWVSFTLGEGAHLEYLPGHTTLYGGSRFVQLTEVDVPTGASMILSDMTLVGRLARGENHQFDALSLGTRITRDGRPLLADTVVTVGAGQGRNTMLWGEYPVWATLVGLAKDSASLMDFVQESLDVPEVQIGVSTLVGHSGVMVRIAGHSPVAVRAALEAAHDVVRRQILGRPAFDLRKL